MNRWSQTMKRLFPHCLILFLTLQWTATSLAADELTFEQIEAIKKDLGRETDKLGMVAHVLQEFMGDEDTEPIIDFYANGLLMVNMSLELAQTGDLEAAAKLLIEKMADDACSEIIKKQMPAIDSWMGWISWAKTGMELFKDIYFDPTVESDQMQRYIYLRESAGDFSEDAIADAYASLQGAPHLLERGKQEFRKQYGDMAFVEGTDDLLPRWREKWLTFVAANMERKYQEIVHQRMVARFQAEAEAVQKQLPEMREKVLELLERTKVDRVVIEPAVSRIPVDGRVTFSATAIYAHPLAPVAARDVTRECTWSAAGGIDGNVFMAGKAHLLPDQPITVTATYGGETGLQGTATVYVFADCGAYGHWNSVSKECECDSGYVYDETLDECVSKSPREQGEEIQEVLADMERPFLEAVKTFDQHFDNFVAGLSSLAGSSAEAICTNANLAFSFARAGVAYELVHSYYLHSLELVFGLKKEPDWERLTLQGYDPQVHVLDWYRLELFHKENQRVSERGESLPTLLAQYAPGCDAENLIDLGARTAEIDQNAETGIDGDQIAWTGGNGGGGGSGGELRFVRSGQVITQIDKQASCTGGALTLNVTTPVFPSEIRPGESVTLSVTFNWSITGSQVEDNAVIAVVHFSDQIKEGQEFTTFSGTRTQNFTFTATESAFLQPAWGIVVAVSGVVLCEGGSGDSATSQYIQGYIRSGGQ
ncbi:MAG: hypothetical protein BWY83_00756 [bacterium ADurb.Bin478]|nr:MAG: hypothetical protein BWY83_00756 [bacterium ADurb.Bin478]